MHDIKQKWWLLLLLLLLLYKYFSTKRHIHSIVVLANVFCSSVWCMCVTNSMWKICFAPRMRISFLFVDYLIQSVVTRNGNWMKMLNFSAFFRYFVWKSKVLESHQLNRGSAFWVGFTKSQIIPNFSHLVIFSSFTFNLLFCRKIPISFQIARFSIMTSPNSKTKEKKNSCKKATTKYSDSVCLFLSRFSLYFHYFT